MTHSGVGQIFELPLESGRVSSSESANGAADSSLGQRPRISVESVSRAESPPQVRSVPHVALVVGHDVFCKEGSIFVLERSRAVVLFLVVNIAAQNLSI